jgi:hypothetical protein
MTRQFYAQRGIRMKPTVGCSPEANGLAERHKTLLEMVSPMFAVSGYASLRLLPMGVEPAGNTVLYGSHQHNVTSAFGTITGRTPREGFVWIALGSGWSVDCRRARHKSPCLNSVSV